MEGGSNSFPTETRHLTPTYVLDRMLRCVVVTMFRVRILCRTHNLLPAPDNNGSSARLHILASGFTGFRFAVIYLTGDQPGRPPEASPISTTDLVSRAFRLPGLP